MCARLRVLLMAAFLMAASGVALADSFTFDMGDSSWIDTSGTASALEMWADVYGSVGSEVFTLNEGDSYSFLFAQMGTHESDVNPDDLIPGAVTAYVDFDIPSLTGDVDGVTVGFRGGWLGFTQGWDLVWSDPVVVDFAGGGKFSLELSDASIRNGWWVGPDGLFDNAYADISATVTLIDAPAIPEPATISLLGLALAGWAVRRKIMA